ncbi:alpha/beta hydrolase [Couchioplanes caeruleus]|nr:hypothetical protein [Couchioplanes caeruleus]
MGGTYGAEMARRGIIGLAIDYRNYGQSNGAIRQYEDPDSKAVDLSSALSYLRSRQDVSGAGLLGICTSGTAVIHAAADDHSVAAVATVAGPFWEPILWTGVQRRLAAGEAARKKYEQTGVVDMVPAYHPINPRAVNTVPMPYYLTARRGKVSEWRNEFAVMAYADMLKADAVTKAAKVVALTLMIHTKLTAASGQSTKVHDRLAGQKELH